MMLCGEEKMKFRAGNKIICTSSTSCAYTVGKVYEVYLNDHKWKCVKGDDGLEGLLSLTLSTFRVYNPKTDVAVIA